MVFLALVTLHVLIAEKPVSISTSSNSRRVPNKSGYEKLRLEVAELEAPARIVSAAEGPLGLRQPGSVNLPRRTPTTATRPLLELRARARTLGPAAPRVMPTGL